MTPSTVTLSVRSDYWQPAPKVKEIRCTTYSGNDTQLTALTSGATDWSYEFLANAKTTFVAKDPNHFKLWFPPALSADGLWINTTKKPFDNAHLRRAMSMVINREDIFVQGEAGYFKPKIDNITGIPTPAGDSFIAPAYKGKKSEADVATAKKELTDNGLVQYHFGAMEVQDKKDIQSQTAALERAVQLLPLMGRAHAEPVRMTTPTTTTTSTTTTST